MEYALGLDNGGTVVKAAVVDARGREIASAGRPTKTFSPRSGFVERDMEEMWQTNGLCVREALEKSGVDPKDVAAVAATGHGKGLYAWGENGPAYNGILSSDNRAWERAEKWKTDAAIERLRAKLLQRILPGHPVAILAWMKDERPDAYDAIKYAFSAKDYIRFRLTGEAFGEMTDMSGSGLMDVANARLDREIPEAFGIGEAYGKLPPLRLSHENCGSVTPEAAKLTGLLAGTPVAGGMFDIDACALAMDITSPDHLCTITGTWTINEFISPAPAVGAAAAMNSLYAIPGWYLVEDSSPTGAGNLDWALKNVLGGAPPADGKELYRRADELAGSAEAADGGDLVFLPFLYGSNTHPNGKSAFVGMTSAHGAAQLLRAVYEGVAFSAKTHIDRLLSLRAPPKAVRLGGGAANSKFWVRMFADALGLPVETVDGVKELGAFGGAMAGFVAAGLYKDYREAAKAMVKLAPPIPPDPSKTEAYSRKYENYQAVASALNAVWPKLIYPTARQVSRE